MMNSLRRLGSKLGSAYAVLTGKAAVIGTNKGPLTEQYSADVPPSNSPFVNLLSDVFSNPRVGPAAADLLLTNGFAVQYDVDRPVAVTRGSDGVSVGERAAAHALGALASAEGQIGMYTHSVLSDFLPGYYEKNPHLRPQNSGLVEVGSSEAAEVAMA